MQGVFFGICPVLGHARVYTTLNIQNNTGIWGACKHAHWYKFGLRLLLPKNHLFPVFGKLTFWGLLSRHRVHLNLLRWSLVQEEKLLF